MFCHAISAGTEDETVHRDGLANIGIVVLVVLALCLVCVTGAIWEICIGLFPALVVVVRSAAVFTLQRVSIWTDSGFGVAVFIKMSAFAD